MESRCARARAKRARVELQLHSGAGARQYRELGAFVRYCVSRIERELGEIEHWSVTIAPAGGEFTSAVSIKDGPDTIESTGAGMDGPLAAWEALCKLEQLLREARARRATNAALATAKPAGRRQLVLIDGGAH
ncbi:MAG TPA: hypothetical protein VHW23_00830 [Kofleriaceae bacterium]|jgi:hypothetical protein|nr:hypothetical protein [Kofleriaceae bacterium]